LAFQLGVAIGQTFRAGFESVRKADSASEQRAQGKDHREGEHARSTDHPAPPGFRKCVELVQPMVEDRRSHADANIESVAYTQPWRQAQPDAPNTTAETCNRSRQRRWRRTCRRFAGCV